MASITLQGRNDLIALYTAMFKAAPNAATLGSMVSQAESGKTTFQIAASLATSTDFTTVYPAFLTKDEFVAKIVGDLLPAGTVQGAIDYAKNWVTGQLNAKVAVSDIFAAAVTALRTTTNADFASAQTQLTNKVTVASYYAVDKLGAATSLTTLQNVISGVTTDAATVTTAKTSVDGVVAAAIGQVYAMTTSVDSFTGNAGNDTFNGQVGGTATLTGLDSIDGGAGNDTLNVNDLTGAANVLAGITVKNVETVNVASTGNATIDTTIASVSGVNTVNVTQGTAATVTAATTTAVNVAGVTGAASVTGGSTQTVTAKGGLTLSGAAGAITGTDSAQAAAATAINNGTSVALTSTATNPTGTTGTITIGGTTAPTGAVTVVSNLTNVAHAANTTTGGAITITGGTTVTVTETAVQSVMTTASANTKIIQPAVSVTGGSATTAVTVNQAAQVNAANTVLAVTAVTESNSVVFGALNAGDTVILGGVTYTAPTGGATAKQAAAAFANLPSGVLTGWTTGAVSGASSDTVTFTSTAAGNVADLAQTGTITGTAPVLTKTDGVAAVLASGRGGVDNGAVTVTDGGNGTITSVTLKDYGNSTITSKGLNSLTLTSTSTTGFFGTGTGVGTVGITHTAGTTLDLTLNSLNGTNTITDSSSGYTTLKVHTATGASTLTNVVDSAATSLSVDGNQVLTLTSAAGLSALKTITVSGTAGLTANSNLAGTLTSVDTTGTTGAVKVTIDPSLTSYAGGAGADTVTITTAVPTKAIAGGAGTDTLVVNIAAATFSNPSANTNITGFEVLGLGALATGSYDATGFTGLTEGAVTAAVTYTNVAAGATLAITAAPGFGTTYTLKDATGTSDSLAMTITSGIAANTVTASGIESVSIAVTAGTSATTSSATLVDTAVKTITLTGGAFNTFTLTNTGNTATTTVDASGFAGGLTYTSVGTVAETIKGGALANTLAASTGTSLADTIIGGAGNDTITANQGLDVLTGNGGNDTFVIVASANVNSYATITDANAGDVIKLVDGGGTDTFSSAKITLAATAVFQDYANAAVNSNGGAAGAISWFQYGGDTYVVENKTAATTDFINGTDLVVKLTGLIDLSTAAFFDNGAGAPEIVLR